MSTIINNGDISLLLLTTQPNMGSGLTLAYTVGTTLDEGLGGRESRRPTHEALRIEQTASFVMEASAADAFRNDLQNLGTNFVGIPIWSDYLTGTDWAQRIHEAQYLVRFSNSTLVAGSSSLVGAEYYAPLLVGRLKDKPSYKLLTVTVAEVTITIREDSPWAYRIAPKDTVSAANFPANLSPDWTDVAEQWTDSVTFNKLGDGRVTTVDGEEHAPKWGQDAQFTFGSRSEIRTMLGFFGAVKGRWASFTAPLWFRPGSNTSATPYTTKARLSSDTLTLSFQSGEVATTRISLWQVPWEINGVSGETPQQSARAFLYKFTYDLPTPVVSRFTNYEKPLAVAGDGTYATARIEHDAIKYAINLDGGTISLNTDRFTGNPLLKFIPFSAEARLLLEIRECAPDNPDAGTVIWSGEITEAQGNGKRIKAKGDVFGFVFERKFPRFLMQQDCNVTLFSTACGVNKTTYTKTGTISAISGTELTIATASTNAEGWFARGDIWVGSGSTLERRMIVASTPAAGTGQTLTVDRPLAQNTTGASVQFWPGCNGQYSTCSGKFSNALRFRGHPFMPKDNPTLKRVATTQDTRKK